jgi:uncharacterized Zn finger protein (UPF0148 family)
MSGPLIVTYALLWTTLLRALLVRAKLLPPTCARCGLPFERRHLGEHVCRCRGDE